MSGIPEIMRASVLLGARNLEVQQRPVPQPAADEVLIRVTSVGVCGSDVHFYEDGRLGDWLVKEPLVLGHESGGEIVAVGSDVSASRVGSRVSIEPQKPSPHSAETLRGQYNLDPAMEFYAVPGTDGAFQEYVTIQSHFAYDISDSISDDAAGLMEPLSVALASVEKAGVGLGDRVFISGAGPIGLIIAQVLRASGVSEIFISDVDTQRRSAATSFGATATIDPATDDVAGLGVDAFLDASGAQPAVASGISSVRPGGRVVLVGMGAQDMKMPVSMIMNRELWVTGVFRYVNTWPTAIKLVESGAVDLDGLVTGRFGLSEVEAAFESTKQPGTLKSVVLPTRE